MNKNFQAHLFSIADVKDKENEGGEGEGEGDVQDVEEDDQEVVEFQKMYFTSCKHWTSLTAGVTAFPQEMKPWETVVNNCYTLTELSEEWSRRVEREREELRKLHERINPAPIVERCHVSTL